jgi:hypothetical protein
LAAFATIGRKVPTRPSLSGSARTCSRKRDAGFFPPNGVGAHQQPRKVQFELVTLSLGVGTLGVTELALKALVDDLIDFFARQPANIARGVDRVEKRGERLTELEAHPAAVAEVERTIDFRLHGFGVPVLRLVRVVRQTFGWRVTDVGE